MSAYEYEGPGSAAHQPPHPDMPCPTCEASRRAAPPGSRDWTTPADLPLLLGTEDVWYIGSVEMPHPVGLRYVFVCQRCGHKVLAATS